ncbi:serine/threonine-protein kinase DCLK1-like [Gigantopelta aegis]|uniref:serine/threonine-protein kinase DCLK1-like n=1 Tax=Gigantopelta aegis TaxID=1735272 RepID=UPI001B888601|nr:serine/threonine-protein kinase DCLK1-like [Gigantopelta aegis]XP_041358692.1 serine/threonine-protein kinase DCLK1-like [Gigantopelta aegis]
MGEVIDDHFAVCSYDDKTRASNRNSRSRPRSPTSHSEHGISIRQSILKYSEEKRAKKVRFYRNGDRFFKGMVYAVSPERFRTFESLLSDLTLSPLCNKDVLPKGVRHIFTVDGARSISSLDDLVEGESYVCASTTLFKKMDYSNTPASPNWNANIKGRSESQERVSPLSKDSEDDTKSFIRPKLVTIIRNGSKPRKAVRVLLNRKTAHSFDQVMSDITDAIKMDSGTVKKIYTLDGQQVATLADFFKEDTMFVAYGQEKVNMDDFDICENEVRLVSAYKRSETNSPRVTLKSPKSIRKVSSHSERRGSGSTSSLTMSPKSPRRVRSGASSSGKDSMTNGVNGINNHTSSDAAKVPTELLERYDIGRVIGEGNFAVVKECLDRYNNRKFSLKIIDKRKCKGKEQMIENEVSILRKVKHPNIVLLVEDYETPHEMYMVMELVKGGDLFDAISSATKYTERDASGMVFNLANALKYLHSLRIVHRDVKPENLLVYEHSDGSKSLKLGDFGLATEIAEDEVLYTVCGTPTYVAPEIIAESGYALKVDVWSAGVITYILLCGFPPFASSSDNQDELFDKIMDGKLEFKAPFWDDVSDSAKELVSKMLIVDTDNRLSALEVVNHPWVADDTAKDEDLHDNVAKELSTHFVRKQPNTVNTAGIRIIASTALDKGSRYFQGRGGAPLSLHPRGSVEAEDEDEEF